MKSIQLLLGLLLTSTLTFAQVTNSGEPKSWRLDQTNDATAVQLPEFDLEKIEAEDAENDQKNDAPWRFGYEHLVDIGLNDGHWTELENGDRIWKLNITSPGAITMNFIFDEFYLPEGAKLYFYNDDRSDLLGAYTSTQNREDLTFGSWLIDGDDVWIEYYEPKEVEGHGMLHISKAIHGYRSVSDNKEYQKALNSSGACNHDVDCDVHDDFDEKKELLKRSVALIVAGGNGFCTGTLINNTENDETPYFLTANHCTGSSVGSWAFRFNWTSDNPQCGTTAPSADGDYDQTLSGANVVASNPGSDFALLEITAPIQDSWDLVWAGWNRSTTPADYAVGIHHPSGDIMKVCREDDSPYMQNVQGTQVWFINQWELGVTEGGSSGSALFNQDGRIIGQLLGGSAACSGTVNNGGVDFYGRLDVSWNSNSATTRLKDWLDPNDTGVMTIDSNPPMEDMSTDDVANFETTISVYPNPTDHFVQVSTETNISFTYDVYTLQGKRIAKGEIDKSGEVDFSSFESGVYLMQLTNQYGETTTKRIIKK